MSSSTHQIKVKAVDQTGGAFSSIQKRAGAAGANISRMLGAAITAGLAYLGARQFLAGVDELGKLSDVAMKASTSVDDLTRAATGLSILGINTDINSLAQAFTKMAATTGRTGMAGFYETINEIGKISDVAKRSEATMKVFGRAGLEFMPLVNAAKDGSDALQNVISAMPHVSQAAADAGDALSDAKTIGVQGFRSLWLDCIGSISRSIDESFAGGVRQAALDGVAWLDFFAKMAYKKVAAFASTSLIAFNGLGSSMGEIFTKLFDYYKSFFSAVGGWISDVVNVSWDDIKANGVFGKANENFSRKMDKASEKLLENVDFDAMGANIYAFDSEMEQLRISLDRKIKENEKAAQAYNEAAISSGGRSVLDGEGSSEQRKPRVNNSLILGGSNESLKLSILGPQTQELKKQTNVLKEISKNTQRTVTAIGQMSSETETLKEVN